MGIEEFKQRLGERCGLCPMHHMAGRGQLDARKAGDRGEPFGLVGRVEAPRSSAHEERRA